MRNSTLILLTVTACFLGSCGTTSVGFFLSQAALDHLVKRIVMDFNVLFKKKNDPAVQPTRITPSLSIFDFQMDPDKVLILPVDNGIHLSIADLEVHLAYQYSETVALFDFAGLADIDLYHTTFNLLINLAAVDVPNPPQKNLTLSPEGRPNLVVDKANIRVSETAQHQGNHVGLTNAFLKSLNLEEQLKKQGEAGLFSFLGETLREQLAVMEFFTVFDLSETLKVSNFELEMDFSPSADRIFYADGSVYYQTDLMVQNTKAKSTRAEYLQRLGLTATRNPPADASKDHVVVTLSDKQVTAFLRPFFDPRAKNIAKLKCGPTRGPRKYECWASVSLMGSTTPFKEVDLTEHVAHLTMLGEPDLTFELTSAPVVKFQPGSIIMGLQFRLYGVITYTTPNSEDKFSLFLDNEGFDAQLTLGITTKTDYVRPKVGGEYDYRSEIFREKKVKCGDAICTEFREVPPRAGKITLVFSVKEATLNTAKWDGKDGFPQTNDMLAEMVSLVTSQLLHTLGPFEVEFPVNKFQPSLFIKEMQVDLNTPGWATLKLLMDYDFKDVFRKLVGLPTTKAKLRQVRRPSGGEDDPEIMGMELI